MLPEEIAGKVLIADMRRIIKIGKDYVKYRIGFL